MRTILASAGFALFSLTGCANSPAADAAETTSAAGADVAAPSADGLSFEAWRDAFIADAGDPAQARRELAGVEPDLPLIELDRAQPEFVRPIWQYLDSAVSPSRVETAKAKTVEHAAVTAALEARYGVDAEILVAIWGLESAFGANIGSYDAIRSLATLAWDGRRRDLFEAELQAALDILASGAATRGELISGWAGAMGQTQFMPSAYLRYAVDHDGDGRKNVWADEGDALASAAFYLAEKGWTKDEPWGVEVRLPAGFDYGLADDSALAVSFWSLQGVSLADGRAWPEAWSTKPARLLIPGGATGPAFLTFPNFDVIKRYNNATAYALAAGLMIDRLQGSAGVRGAWPVHERPLKRVEIEELQTLLSGIGYDTGGVDGLVGPNTRKAVRAWQRAKGLPADAFVTHAMLQAVRAEAAR